MTTSASFRIEDIVPLRRAGRACRRSSLSCFDAGESYVSPNRYNHDIIHLSLVRNDSSVRSLLIRTALCTLRVPVYT